MDASIKMQGVREHAEGYDVECLYDPDAERWVIQALNEGGYNLTRVDLFDLLEWLHSAGILSQSVSQTLAGEILSKVEAKLGAS